MRQEERRAMWRARIDQWQQSGLRLTEFARQHQLDIKRLRYWRALLSSDGQAPEAKVLIPLRIQTAAASFPATSLTITSPGGWCVSLPTTAPAAWLGELLMRLP